MPLLRTLPVLLLATLGLCACAEQANRLGRPSGASARSDSEPRPGTPEPGAGDASDRGLHEPGLQASKEVIAECIKRIHRKLMPLADTYPQLSRIRDAEVTAASLIYRKGSRRQLPGSARPPGEPERKGGPYEYSEENACYIGIYLRHPVYPSPLTRCSDMGHYYEKAKLKLGLHSWSHGRKSWEACTAAHRVIREQTDKLAKALETR